MPCSAENNTSFQKFPRAQSRTGASPSKVGNIVALHLLFHNNPCFIYFLKRRPARIARRRELTYTNAKCSCPEKLGNCQSELSTDRIELSETTNFRFIVRLG